MKDVMYFIVGLLILPLHAVLCTIEFIRDLGSLYVRNVMFNRRVKRNLKIWEEL